MTAQYRNRIQVFQKSLSPAQVGLVSKPAEISYFTGFETLVPEEREAYFLVTATKAVLFHASFSPVTKISGIEYLATTSLEAVSKKISELVEESIRSDTTLSDELPEIATHIVHESNKITDLLLDYSSLFVTEFKALEKIATLSISPTNQQKIWQQRMIKDEFEQAAIQKAATLTKETLEHLQSLITQGKTEAQLAWEVESYIKQQGGVLAFPTIVAYGPHAALPHHQPTSKNLQLETPILLDFGAKVDGYCSDMTRTIWFGEKPSREFLNIELAVKAAYDAALQVCEQFVQAYAFGASNFSADGDGEIATDTPSDISIPISQLDTAARTSLEKAGYGKNFIHTTGHGLGLEIHEQPSIYKTTTTLLQPGMVFTIEPGVYLPEKIGYRYENTILLLKNKVVELTR